MSQEEFVVIFYRSFLSGPSEGDQRTRSLHSGSNQKDPEGIESP